MSDLLSDLPREILLMIIKELCGRQYYFCEGRDDLWEWSRTSTIFGNLIAPFIYDVVELRCHNYFGWCVNDIASGAYGHLVRKIQFYVNIDECNHFEEPFNPAESLP